MVTNCSRTHIVLSTTKYFYSYKKDSFLFPSPLLILKEYLLKKQSSKQTNMPMVKP